MPIIRDIYVFMFPLSKFILVDMSFSMNMFFPFSSMSLSTTSSYLSTLHVSCSILFASTISSTSPSLPKHNSIPISYSTEPPCAFIPSSIDHPCLVNHHSMGTLTTIFKPKFVYATHVTIFLFLKI